MPVFPHAHQLGRRTPSAKAPLDQSFLLQRVQPALSGLMDGSLSTLAPIFAVVLATHSPITAFFTGLATALGAGVSMAFSEGLSDTGDLTGRGNPFERGAITGGGTFVGGVFHTLPFLISDYHVAIVAAGAVVAVELVVPQIGSLPLQGSRPAISTLCTANSCPAGVLTVAAGYRRVRCGTATPSSAGRSRRR
jgi:hypothetical protein